MTSVSRPDPRGAARIMSTSSLSEGLPARRSVHGGHRPRGEVGAAPAVAGELVGGEVLAVFRLPSGRFPLHAESGELSRRVLARPLLARRQHQLGVLPSLDFRQAAAVSTQRARMHVAVGPDVKGRSALPIPAAVDHKHGIVACSARGVCGSRREGRATSDKELGRENGLETFCSANVER